MTTFIWPLISPVSATPSGTGLSGTGGFGSEPAAGSGAGIGVLSENDALVDPGFQKSSTGAVSSIKIDGAISDIVLDEFGNEEGMPDAAQCVQIAFGTKQGEIAVDPEAGVRWPSKLGPGVLNQMRAEAARVLAPLTNIGMVELVDVEIETEGTTLYGVVVWHDLRTNTERRTKLPIG